MGKRSVNKRMKKITKFSFHVFYGGWRCWKKTHGEEFPLNNIQFYVLFVPTIFTIIFILFVTTYFGTQYTPY